MAADTENERAVGLIAARMGSSRFAGKTLSDLHGAPMLGRIVERLRASDNIDRIVLATTELVEDDALEEWCAGAEIDCFRGSSDDVLGRLLAAACAFDANLIVEVLGDNPLIHSAMIDAAVDLYRSDRPDYVATVTNEYKKADSDLKRFPIGVRVQVMPLSTLRRCEELARTHSEREHATSFIADNPEIFKSAFVEATGTFAGCHRPELTFAVNHRENLELIRGIFEHCYDSDSNFSVADAVRAFESDDRLHPLMGAQ